jgi:L-asparaginase/Glu-tRNA(Gln) amidotransferase subunit D
MSSLNAYSPETTAQVLIIYTGGTIGMKPTSTGLQPVKGYLPDYLSKLPQFHDPEQAQKLTTPMSRFGRRVHYEIMEWDDLLDSSNSTFMISNSCGNVPKFVSSY